MPTLQDSVPLAAKQLYAIGPHTEAAVRELFREQQGLLFPDREKVTNTFPPEDFELLARALFEPPRWSDEQAEVLILHLAQLRSHGKTVDIPLVSRWVLAHPNDASLVSLCMDVEPPREVEIRKVLSRAGSQKIVFLGSWRLTQREVVVKRLLHRDGTADRELESFPLTLSHPNIIETHRLQNESGELFLVEERLAEVLDDTWTVPDVQEAANFLYDIAGAIKHLNDNDRVHGDIKPDNIGKRQGEFVLLDFGICRPTAQFQKDTTATGSLRTRAPELLLTDSYDEPPKVDVWALGATLFKGYVGRFPLLDPKEPIPRTSHPSEREQFERELSRRVRDEWDKRVDPSLVPVELRNAVSRMLEKDPTRRIGSAELFSEIEREFPAFIRGASEKAQRIGRFSPLEELEQMTEYIRSLSNHALLPAHKRARLRERLHELENTQGFTERDKQRVRALSSQLVPA